MSPEIKSEYINIVCDQLIKIKFDYNNAVNHILDYRYQYCQIMDTETIYYGENSLGITEQIQAQYNTASPVLDAVEKQKRWKPLTDIYDYKQQSVSNTRSRSRSR